MHRRYRKFASRSIKVRYQSTCCNACTPVASVNFGSGGAVAVLNYFFLILVQKPITNLRMRVIVCAAKNIFDGHLRTGRQE